MCVCVEGPEGREGSEGERGLRKMSFSERRYAHALPIKEGACARMPDEILGWCYSAFFDGMPTSQLSEYAEFMADPTTQAIKSLADFRDNYALVKASFLKHNFAEQYAAYWKNPASNVSKPLERHAASEILQYFAALHAHLQLAGADQVEHQIRAIRTQTAPHTDPSAFHEEFRDWILSDAFRNRPQPMRERKAGTPYYVEPGHQNTVTPSDVPAHNLARLLHQLHVVHQTQ
jgi:hypothetical protein